MLKYAIFAVVVAAPSFVALGHDLCGAPPAVTESTVV